MTRARARRGFTLLEVMISLAILAVALVALSDLNGTAVQMHAYARRATAATFLLRSKMLDLEEQLHKDGFSDFDDEKHGTFEDDGAPEYTWRAEIIKPNIKLDASQLLSMLGVDGKGGKNGSTSSSSSGAPSGPLGALGGLAGGLFGGAAGAGGAGAGLGLAAMGPMAAMVQGQATQLIETLKKSVREVRLTITWRDGKDERSISASQQLVILPESVGKAGQTITPGSLGKPAPVGGPATLPGGKMPFPNNASPDGDNE